MAHAIIRGKYGRRYEVEFEDASKFMPVRRPSRSLWRLILKRTQKTGDVLR